MFKEFSQSKSIQFAFVISIVFSLYAIYLFDQYNYQQQRSLTQKIASSHASLINNNINLALSATYPLAALVKKQNGGVIGFTELATEMLPLYSGVASLQLQPSGILKHIVPLEGNEGAIGHSVLNDPSRNKEALLARDTGKLTLAGPFDLIQGGVGAAARLPIYIEAPEGRHFWGFSAVLIRFPEVLNAANLPSLVESGIAYRLSRIHPDTGKTQLISSSDQPLKEDPESFDIKVPNGIWNFQVSPINGWRSAASLILVGVLGILFTFLMTFLVILVSRLKTNKDNLERTVSERTKELDKVNYMLTTVLYTIPVRVFWKDTKLNYLGANSLFANDAGTSSPEELVGKSDFDMPWKDTDAENYRTDDMEVINSGLAKINIEEKQLNASGDTKWLNTNKIPLKDRDGNILGVLGTYDDITDRKQMEESLIEAKDSAETANRAKSEFLSSMSHELRTPLNSILGFAQLLESDEEKPLLQEQKESVDYIISSGQHLLNLVNDVLELSAIEAGKTLLCIGPVPLLDVIDDSVTLLTPLANKANIAIHVLSDLALSVNADYIKLKQIIINLVTNAIKYNHRGGSVSLDWDKTEKETVRINISDTGIGISETNQQKLFNAFSRLGQENSIIEGTGIGLVITKDLVQLMGGEIGFNSVEDEGTTFWIELPIAEQTMK